MVKNRVAYCEGRKVATVYWRPNARRWEICWHSRGDSREVIAGPVAAKDWVERLLRGKHVEWKIERWN